MTFSTDAVPKILKNFQKSYFLFLAQLLLVLLLMS